MLRFSAGNLSLQPGIAHAFFSRKGGVSSGLYASLNCGPGSRDERAHVIENRARAASALGTHETRLVTLYQVHGSVSVRVEQPWEIGDAPRADAAVTNLAGIALGILTADCAPILLADTEARVVAAVHAGWKGALAGIIESALATMEQLGARRERVASAIGPCISRQAYEVGEDMRLKMLEDEPPSEIFFEPADRCRHWRFDLAGFAEDRLVRGGVRDVSCLGLCTYDGEAAFYSYRRATHRGENDYGRQLSAILLTP